MYHYTLSGLPNVYLENGYSIESTPYGESISIQDIKGLHAAIGLSVIEHPDVLTAEEIRFLRKEMDLSQKCLADLLSVKEVTVRKWESGDNNISGAADRLLRVLYKESVNHDSSIKVLLEKIAHLDKKLSVASRIQFSNVNDGWHKNLAA